MKIYSRPTAAEALDQGDLIDNCPIVEVAAFNLDRPDQPLVECATHRIVVLTQACDLAKHFADTFSRIGLPLPYETE